MRRELILIPLILFALEAKSQCCFVNGVCQPWSPILGDCARECSCEPPLTESGIIDWRPPQTNYIEGPWATRIHNFVYIGGHAGWCCEDFRPDGTRAHDRFWTILYQAPGNTGDPVYRYQDLPLDSERDDHECGDYSPLYIGGKWLFFAARTERSDWGTFNRLRPFTLTVSDPVFGNLIPNRDPLFPPADPDCEEIGTRDPNCEHSIGNGQHISGLITKDGRILTLSKDDVGYMNHRTEQTSSRVVHLIDPITRKSEFLYEAHFGIDTTGKEYTPSISDWARGKDNLFYAYGGNQPVSKWYDSTSIIEWVSSDEGLTWIRTSRQWRVPPGICIWDAGVMRDASGKIADPLTLVAVRAPCGSWASNGEWKLWWWTADHTEMPFRLIWP